MFAVTRHHEMMFCYAKPMARVKHGKATARKRKVVMPSVPAFTDSMLASQSDIYAKWVTSVEVFPCMAGWQYIARAGALHIRLRAPEL